jgi:hypothetical protein
MIIIFETIQIEGFVKDRELVLEINLFDSFSNTISRIIDSLQSQVREQGYIPTEFYRYRDFARMGTVVGCKGKKV